MPTATLLRAYAAGKRSRENSRHWAADPLHDCLLLYEAEHSAEVAEFWRGYYEQEHAARREPNAHCPDLRAPARHE